MMNNYYYGKSGKGDFKKDDLPQNRWQLFWDMLRTRLSGLCRMNLTVFAAWLPLIILLGYNVLSLINWMGVVNTYSEYLQTGELGEYLTMEAVGALQELMAGREPAQFLADLITESIPSLCLWCIPCILITGPVQAGMAYVTRNWARDEHAFAWSDFKDAVKANWKQGLVISGITSLIPIIAYTSYTYYGQMAETQGAFFMIPQMLVITMSGVWLLSLVFMYPIIVQYEIKTLALIKNGIILAIARLPQTIGIRLITLIPGVICVGIFWFTFSELALLALVAYYVLIGFALTRFIHASYTNGVFDKYINSRMEGVEVNRGLASDLDDDDEEDEQETQTLSE
ncbi:MAG: DUF624 domain-containing protein [Clostridia bacterium]|nr:DUF624 domain-containing protein [Clostridia bacterium]